VHGTLERGADVQTILVEFEPTAADVEEGQHMRDMCEACVDLGGA
jgi:hypothetical protein